jgi:hypothetical protein
LPASAEQRCKALAFDTKTGPVKIKKSLPKTLLTFVLMCVVLHTKAVLLPVI